MGFFCIGHRGAKGHAPENTLPSFEKALALGCPWIELDVHLAGGELVVIHDDTVDRTTNGKGALADMTLPEIRRLDAGGGAQVPLLGEVIDMVNHRANINIELKGAGTAVATSRLLDGYCGRGWAPDEFLISSFSHDELALAHRRYRRGALFSELFSELLFDEQAPDLWQKAGALGAWSVNLHWKLVSKALVDEAHRRGYKMLAYTVNEPRAIRDMIDCGVDGVFSDYPDRVLEMTNAGQR